MEERIQSPQNDTTAAPAQYGRNSRLKERVAKAYKIGGLPKILSELHNMLLFRFHDRVLDKFFTSKETDIVAKTTFLKSLTILGENKEQGNEYTPSPFLVTKWAIESSNDNHSSWNFIDVGSGRGRVLTIASQFAFDRIIGVEFAKELHDEATQYIHSHPSQLVSPKKIELLNVDATTFDIPNGPCLFYLFNPFGEPVMESFLEHVLTSYEANPRPMKFAYSNPVHLNVFLKRKDLKLVRKSPLEWVKFNLLSPHRFVLFELKP